MDIGIYARDPEYYFNYSSDPAYKDVIKKLDRHRGDSRHADGH